jgi:hypothetical protein
MKTTAYPSAESHPSGARRGATVLPRHPRKAALCLAVTLAVALASSALATPVLEGPIEPLFDVQPGDCLGCSPAEIQTLAGGLALAEQYVHEATLNPYGEVCVANASLVREMVVLTFNQGLRTGRVTLDRWHEVVKEKALAAGGVTPEADKLLNPGGSSGIQVSRLLRETGDGGWSPQEWTIGQGSPAEAGHGWVPQAGRSLRADFQRTLSNPAKRWMEGQTSHLTDLPPDFATAYALAQRDSLQESYQQAIEGNLRTTMMNGCGLEAREGLQAAASGLSGIPVNIWDKQTTCPPVQYPGDGGGTLTIVPDECIEVTGPPVPIQPPNPPAGPGLPGPGQYIPVDPPGQPPEIGPRPGGPTVGPPGEPGDDEETPDGTDESPTGNRGACVLLSIFASGDYLGFPNPFGYTEEAVIFAIASVFGGVGGLVTDVIMAPFRLDPELNQDYTNRVGQNEYSTFPAVQTVIESVWGGFEEFEKAVREVCGD